jgi:hypothetical protein
MRRANRKDIQKREAKKHAKLRLVLRSVPVSTLKQHRNTFTPYQAALDTDDDMESISEDAEQVGPSAGSG